MITAVCGEKNFAFKQSFEKTLEQKSTIDQILSPQNKALENF